MVMEKIKIRESYHQSSSENEHPSFRALMRIRDDHFHEVVVRSAMFLKLSA